MLPRVQLVLRALIDLEFLQARHHLELRVPLAPPKDLVAL